MRNQKEIENAISYLVNNINSTGHNPKPVILHSIRIAMYLYNYEYPDYIVIAALLHDLLEDTKVSLADIKNEFGLVVANLVESVTFNPKIENKEDRWKDEEDRAIREGKDALIIKTADFIDNMDYYTRAEDKDKLLYPLNKAQYFIRNAEIIMQGEPIWKDLTKKFSNLTE